VININDGRRLPMDDLREIETVADVIEAADGPGKAKPRASAGWTVGLSYGLLRTQGPERPRPERRKSGMKAAAVSRCRG
jgi:hypothetical protein